MPESTTPRSIIRVYLVLTLFNTLAASLIWGVNTLFLLDAGLSNTEAFLANAFFTVGMVVFEVPTGVVADTRGRRLSYLLGIATLVLATALYLLMWATHAPFAGWAVASVALGLGFTFFSGATDAWLVDALKATGYTGTLEAVFSRAQIVGGAAMLGGSIAGGLLAQLSNLGVPYVVRAGLLVVTFVVAWFSMRDIGFVPERAGSYGQEIRRIVGASVTYGFRRPAVRWMILAGVFSSAVGVYAFYAAQPYLLELFGDKSAYWIAGLAAAIAAGAQIVGGLVGPALRRLFARRTTIIMAGVIASAAILLLIGVVGNFWLVLVLIVLWALVGAATSPARQAYLNEHIPGSHRATVLSFDSMLGSAGGVLSQPLLGRSADVWGYGASFVISAIIQVFALPFVALARRARGDEPDTRPRAD